MRTSALLLAASFVALAPRLAFAEDPPAALPLGDAPAFPAPTAPPPATTVVVVPTPAAPPAYGYAPPPLWYQAPSADAIVMRRRNKGLMIGGLVMIPIGLVGLIGGIALVANVKSEQSGCTAAANADFSDAVSASLCGVAHGIDQSMKLSLSYTMAISGGMMIAGGTAMAIVGGQIVPRKQRMLPRVGIGPGSVDLAWTF